MKKSTFENCWTKSEHFDDSPKLFNFSKPSKCSFWRSEISKLLKFELFGQGLKLLDFPREYAPIAIFLPYKNSVTLEREIEVGLTNLSNVNKTSHF